MSPEVFLQASRRQSSKPPPIIAIDRHDAWPMKRHMKVLGIILISKNVLPGKNAG
jgi:hypothetical protein